MAKRYSLKNRYVFRARPEVTEDVVVELVKSMYRLVPASKAAQHLPISRQTIAAYYEALFVRLFLGITADMAAPEVTKFHEALENSEYANKDENAVRELETFAERLSNSFARRFDEVLAKAYFGIYKDKKARRIDSGDFEIIRIFRRPVEKWPPEYSEEVLALGVLPGLQEFSAEEPKSIVGLVIRSMAAKIDDDITIAMEQLVASTYLNFEEYFRQNSILNKGMSAPLFKRAYVLLILKYGKHHAGRWQDPQVLLDDLEANPLDLSAKSVPSKE